MLRLATEKDLPAIVSIIREAQAFLRSLGVDQWQDGYPDEQAMRGDIRDGVCYALEHDGRVCGVTAIVFTGEPTYDVIADGAWATPLPYACIHRLALAGASRGSGASGALMREAEAVIRARGFFSVRVDTHRDNRVMRRMLEKNGYAARGTIFLENGSPRVAYDKALA